MARIGFTVEDLTRVRLAPGAGDALETVFALDRLARNASGPFDRWRRRTCLGLGARAVEVKRLARLAPSALGLLPLLGAPEHAAVVHGFGHVAVEPHRAAVHGYLEAVQAAWARVLATGGVELLLSTLHPAIRWESPVLVVPGGDDEVDLAGRGLVIAPSLFLAAPGGAYLGSVRDVPTLVVSCPPDRAAAAALWAGTAPGRQPLVSLIGRTRAAVLHALLESCTTGELALRLGISPSSASRHASVLRQAGLLTTSRSRGSSLHSLTSLGLGLVRRRYDAVRNRAGERSARSATDDFRQVGELSGGIV